MAMIERSRCPVCDAIARHILFEKEGGRYVQCDECALVYSDPVVDEGELKATADEWAKCHHGSGERLAWENDDRIARVLFGKRMKIIEPYRNNGRILDVGCSTGMFLGYVATHGWKPYGCEIASYTAAIAKERLGENIMEGAFADMKYDASYFDVVTMWDVIEHTIDPKAFMREAFRVLKPGGLLVIATPNYDALTRRILGRSWEALYPTRHVEVFNASNLSKLVSSYGGKVKEIRRIDVNPFEIIAGLGGRKGGFEVKKASVSKVKGLFAKHPVFAHARDGLNSILSATGLGDVLEIYAEKSR